MVIKEAVYETCEKCGSRRLIKDSVMCCDNCKKTISGDFYLNSTVFHKDNPSISLYFCSWKCFFKMIKKVKCDYFIGLPMLHYDRGGVSASEFWKYIKKIR